KTFSRLAERAIATNNHDRRDTRSQRSARLQRRITGCFGFVGLILNAGGVELFLNGGPQAPRTRGAVVDNNEISRGHELGLLPVRAHEREASHQLLSRSADRCR